MLIRARKNIDKHGIKHYEIYGPLFFGSIELFNSKFDVKEDPKEEKIELSAQKYLLKFYSELGFEKKGEEYLEDNIPHVKMILKI